VERDLVIATPDGAKIHGSLRGEARERLVIFVHGLTGHRNEHQFYNGARYLTDQRGVASFRFNLYGDEEGARTMTDCTLAIHAADLDAVVAYFRAEGVARIGVVGHSYGAPTILLSRKDVQAIVLWDPSYGDLFRDAKRLTEDLYTLGWGPEFLIGKEMIEERARVDWDHLTDELNVPLRVIAAGAGVLLEGSKRYVERAAGSADLKVIDGATHTFREDGAAEQLFEQTVEWFGAHL
jgi:pimeloyl-ACP methyl ester carboxylesterase